MFVPLWKLYIAFAEILQSRKTCHPKRDHLTEKCPFHSWVFSLLCSHVHISHSLAAIFMMNKQLCLFFPIVHLKQSPCCHWALRCPITYSTTSQLGHRHKSLALGLFSKLLNHWGQTSYEECQLPLLLTAGPQPSSPHWWLTFPARACACLFVVTASMGVFTFTHFLIRGPPWLPYMKLPPLLCSPPERRHRFTASLGCEFQRTGPGPSVPSPQHPAHLDHGWYSVRP